MAMPLTEPWTLERLDRLPDDENRYELVDGELLVTPPPSDVHEAIADWLGDSSVRSCARTASDPSSAPAPSCKSEMNGPSRT